jgi:transcription antitermination factor NusG
MSYWTVVQTETQREHIARVWMMRSGYQTYAPRIRLKGNRVALLFPTYIFARIVDRWYPIVSTPGVLRILMSGDQPGRLPDTIIEGIRKREVGGFVKLPPKHPRRGQRVKIIRGSFEGHVAVYDGMSGPARERVLLELLGQLVTVELPARDVVPLNLASVANLRY